MSEERSARSGPRPLESCDLLVAGGSPDLCVTISPEPTADERDAIVAALAVLTTARTDHHDQVAVPGPTPWQRVARDEAIRSGDDFDDRRGGRGWR